MRIFRQELFFEDTLYLPESDSMVFWKESFHRIKRGGKTLEPLGNKSSSICVKTRSLILIWLGSAMYSAFTVVLKFIFKRIITLVVIWSGLLVISFTRRQMRRQMSTITKWGSHVYWVLHYTQSQFLLSRRTSRLEPSGQISNQSGQNFSYVWHLLVVVFVPCPQRREELGGCRVRCWDCLFQFSQELYHM